MTAAGEGFYRVGQELLDARVTRTATGQTLLEEDKTQVHSACDAGHFCPTHIQ